MVFLLTLRSARLLVVGFLVFQLVVCPSFGARTADSTSSAIRLNTLGFLPDHLKRASTAAPCTDFSVVDEADGGVAFRGKTSGPLHNEDTNEELSVADFSALTKPGRYHLEVKGVGRSAPFRVGRDVYDFAFRTSVRAMYLWRCGTSVTAEHEGVT